MTVLAKKTNIEIKPEGVTVTLEPLDYYKLRTSLLDLQVIETEALQKIAAARAKRDAIYAGLAEQHKLPVNPASIQWNDDTHEVSVKGQ